MRLTSLSALRPLLLTASALVLTLGSACGDDTKTQGDGGGDDTVGAPALDACPVDTPAATVLLRGDKARNTSVWLQRITTDGQSDGTPPTRVSAESPDARWQYDLELGDAGTTTRFILFARAGNDESDPTPRCEVTRTTENICEAFSIDDFNDFTREANLTLTGSKAAIGAVEIDGTEVAGADGSSSWSFDATLEPGSNSFVVTPVDPNGNESCSPVIVNVTYSPPGSVCAPNVAAAVQRCADAGGIYELSGERCAGEDLSIWTRRPTQSIDDAIEASAAGSGAWSASVALTPDENGEAEVIFHARNAAGDRSPEVTVTVTIDASAPAAPTINDFATCTASPTLVVNGSREAGSDLVRIIDGADDTVLDDGDGESWNGSLPLSEGSNDFVLAATDACGNTSEPLNISVVRDATAPVLEVTSPTNGDVVEGDTVDVTGTADDGEGCGIDTVQVCLGDACQDSVLDVSGGFSATDLDLTGVEDCAPAEIDVVVTDLAGNTSRADLSLGLLRGITTLSEGSTDHATRPAIARTPNGTVFVAWQDASTNGATQHDIYYRTWNGIDCTSVVRLSATEDLGAVDKDRIEGADNTDPAVAVDAEGNVHLVWEHNGDAGGSGDDRDILHVFWDATSGTLDGTVTVVSDTSLDSSDPTLAVDTDGNAWALWSERAGGDNFIYHRRVGASGASLEACADMSQPSGNNARPDAAFDSLGRLHLVWQGDGNDHDLSDPFDPVYDEEIYYCMRRSNGSWGGVQALSDDDQDGRSLAPRLSPLVGSDAGDVAVVWHDDGAILDGGSDYDVYMRLGDDAGFGNYRLVSAATDGVDAGDARDASVAVDPTSGDIHVVWVDERDIFGKGGDKDVVHRAFDPNGGATTVVTDLAEPDCATEPVLVISPTGGQTVVWQSLIGRPGNLCAAEQSDDPSAPNYNENADTRDIFLTLR